MTPASVAFGAHHMENQVHKTNWTLAGTLAAGVSRVLPLRLAAMRHLGDRGTVPPGGGSIRGGAAVASESDRLQRRLAALLLGVTLALAGLVWQISDLRAAMLDLVDRQLVEARHRVPTPEQLTVVRTEFDALQIDLAWRLRVAAALGFTGLALAITLVAATAVRPRRSPVAEAIARLDAALDDARRLVARLEPITCHVKDDLRKPPHRR